MTASPVSQGVWSRSVGVQLPPLPVQFKLSLRAARRDRLCLNLPHKRKWFLVENSTTS